MNNRRRYYYLCSILSSAEFRNSDATCNAIYDFEFFRLKNFSYFLLSLCVEYGKSVLQIVGTLSQRNHRVSPDIYCVTLDILRSFLFHNEFSLIFSLSRFGCWITIYGNWGVRRGLPWQTNDTQLKWEIIWCTRQKKKKNKIHATLFTCNRLHLHSLLATLDTATLSEEHY